MARARFAGAIDDVVEILVPHAKVPDFILYETSVKAKLEVAKIKACRGVWVSVYKVHPSLAFSQKFMTSVFAALADRCGKTVWARSLSKAEVLEILRERRPCLVPYLCEWGGVTIKF